MYCLAAVRIWHTPNLRRQSYTLGVALDVVRPTTMPPGIVQGVCFSTARVKTDTILMRPMDPSLARENESE
jgi:hypothetical protein